MLKSFKHTSQTLTVFRNSFDMTLLCKKGFSEVKLKSSTPSNTLILKKIFVKNYE